MIHRTTSEEPLQRWHRLFGLLLTDYLSGSPFTVMLEMDLSQKQQLRDVLIVQRRPGRLTRPLPDGLDDLVAHNLISFKSYREALTDSALKELTGHYVNYRKQVSPRLRPLPEDQFRMYAVCAAQAAGPVRLGAAAARAAGRLCLPAWHRRHPYRRGRRVAAGGAKCPVVPVQRRRRSR